MCWYTQVRGTDPQSGQEVDEWNCAVSWMPMMSIEIGKRQEEQQLQ